MASATIGDLRRTLAGMLPQLLGVLDTYPGFLPGLIVALVISLATSGAVARWLGVRRSLAWLLLMGYGATLAATLTPGRESLDFGFEPGGLCDLSRMRPAPLALLSLNYSTMNVCLLVPLGLAIGLLPRSWRKGALLIVAAGMIFWVEMIQAFAPALGRRCQSGDVVDNLTGLLIGLAIGSLVGFLIPTLARGRVGPGSHDDADLGTV